MKSYTGTALILVTLLALTACFDGDGIITPPTDLTTPVKTLGTVESAFNEKALDKLALCLADDFTFHFDPMHVGTDVGGYIIPESWERDEMLGACGKMFEQAYSINLVIETSGVGDPGEGATYYMAEDVCINLLVMIDSLNGFEAQGFNDFRFVNVGSGANDSWVISDWWEHAAGGRGFETEMPYSFGRILLFFYEKPG